MVINDSDYPITKCGGRGIVHALIHDSWGSTGHARVLVVTDKLVPGGGKVKNGHSTGCPHLPCFLGQAWIDVQPSYWLRLQMVG